MLTDLPLFAAKDVGKKLASIPSEVQGKHDIHISYKIAVSIMHFIQKIYPHQKYKVSVELDCLVYVINHNVTHSFCHYRHLFWWVPQSFQEIHLVCHLLHLPTNHHPAHQLSQLFGLLQESVRHLDQRHKNIKLWLVLNKWKQIYTHYSLTLSGPGGAESAPPTVFPP